MISDITHFICLFSKESVCENLDVYIEQAKNFVDNNPAEQESHCIELSLLIIQCLEVSILPVHSKSRCNVIVDQF